MPIYEYECPEHDVRVDMRFAVADRPDEIVLRRKTVPSRVSVRDSHGAPTPDAKDQVLNGYKALEDSGRLGRGEFTPDQIKEAWKES